MDFPALTIPAPSHINSYMSLSGGRIIRASGAQSVSSGSWPAVNLALFIPLFLPYSYNVARVFWVNGATVAGNSDIGIYTPSGARIWSAGSTANSGTSIPQYVTSGIQLSPGVYYLGYVTDSATQHVFGGSAGSSYARLLGLMQMAAAMPLPDPVTFGVDTVSGGVSVPLMGITRTTTGF